MTIAEQFISELTQEAATTRRVLERIPEAQLSWRPHPKSMSLGQLAHHISVLPRAIAELVTQTSADAPNVPRPEAASVGELLSVLESSVQHATQKLAGWNDEAMQTEWTLTREGKSVLQLPRAAVIRAVLLNHWYHHRGQLTVYLRLLDVPLPSVYGPSADEQMFG